MELYRRIRTLRVRQGMTGTELARRAGVSPSYVSLIEHGEKTPSEDVAVRLARALGEQEDLYRIWAVTARMNAATRAAVMGSRAEPPLEKLDPEPPDCPQVSCPMREDAPRPAQPVHGWSQGGGARAEERPASARAVHSLLDIPLLAPGSRGERPVHEETEEWLALDARLIGRQSARGLVALRIDELGGQDAAPWLLPGDIAVIERGRHTLESRSLHVFRLEDGPLRVQRASLNEEVLILHPAPDSLREPTVIRLDGPLHLQSMFFGTVIWSSRRTP